MLVVRLATVTSTQDEAFRLLDQGQAVPFVVTANEQTGARGRRGRTWIFEKDRSLGFSLVERGNVSRLSALSLVMGLGVVEFLNSPEFLLKWPNDIMKIGQPDTKVGGILIESRSQGEEVEVVIGVGLNLENLQTAFYEGIGKPIDLQSLITHLHKKFLEFEANGFGSFHNQYESLLWRRGQSANISVEGMTMNAKILGVTESGFLKLQDGSNLQLLTSGEVLYEHALS